jgi:hypothetical protein
MTSRNPSPRRGAGPLYLALAVCLVAALAMASGCGGKNTATVSGNVTYDGKPIDKGSVSFIPKDGAGPVSAGEIIDGAYRAANVTPGTKIVKIIGVRKVKFALSQEEMAKAAQEATRTGDDSGMVERADLPGLPEAKGNNVEVEIKPGAQTLNFDLKKP